MEDGICPRAAEMLLSEAKYHQIVDCHIAPLMGRLGFDEKKKGSFYLLDDGCTKRVACGLSKTRGEDTGSLSVTVCVGFKVLEDFLSECKELAKHVNVHQDKRGLHDGS